MSWRDKLEKLRHHPKIQEAMEKAEEKAKDPEFQAKIKAAAQRQATQRRRAASQGTAAPPIGRRAFAGGGPGTIGYPWGPGDPLYGTYAYPGYYQDGQWYEQDSDGDGVPDSQDADPDDPNVQDAGQPDTDGDQTAPPDEQGSVDPDGGFDQGGESTQYADPGPADIPDAAGDTYSDSGYDSGYDSGGYDGGGDSGGGE